MSKKMKSRLWGLFAVAMVVVFAVWMYLNPGPEHMEDVNGADDHSLAVITMQDIAAQQMGSRGGPAVTKTSDVEIGGITISNGEKYSAKKFTGVYTLSRCTLFKGSDIHLMLSDFDVREGNFGFFIVFDGQVLGEATPDEFGTVDFLYQNVEKTGTLEYVLAGESADFSFTSFEDFE